MVVLALHSDHCLPSVLGPLEFLLVLVQQSLPLLEGQVVPCSQDGRCYLVALVVPAGEKTEICSFPLYDCIVTEVQVNMDDLIFSIYCV